MREERNLVSMNPHLALFFSVFAQKLESTQRKQQVAQAVKTYHFYSAINILNRICRPERRRIDHFNQVCRQSNVVVYEHGNFSHIRIRVCNQAVNLNNIFWERRQLFYEIYQFLRNNIEFFRTLIKKRQFYADYSFFVLYKNLIGFICKPYFLEHQNHQNKTETGTFSIINNLVQSLVHI